jgi:hypothetical protein
VAELVSLLRRYIVLPPHAAEALALWVLHTYSVAATAFSPRLAIRGPTKRCGKTRVLRVLAAVVRRPLKTENASIAALFRLVERDHPTLLVDEYDAWGRGNEELRGLLNAGYEGGGRFLRAVGEEHTPRAFDVFSAAAIALIGELPSTVRDRAVDLLMQRKTGTERVERLPRADRLAASCGALRARIARWTQDHVAALSEASPDLPEALDDRAADLWEPLLAIADEVGSEWPVRARAAALALSGARSDNDHRVQLLTDVRSIFAMRSVDRLASADLLSVLVAMGERPWPTWGRGDRPMSPRHLAEMLGEFGIVSRTIRLPSGRTPKGYPREAFEEAFARYLPPVDATLPQSRPGATGEDQGSRHDVELVATGNGNETPENPGQWRGGAAEGAEPHPGSANLHAAGLDPGVM